MLLFHRRSRLAVNKISQMGSRISFLNYEYAMLKDGGCSSCQSKHILYHVGVCSGRYHLPDHELGDSRREPSNAASPLATTLSFLDNLVGAPPPIQLMATLRRPNQGHSNLILESLLYYLPAQFERSVVGPWIRQR